MKQINSVGAREKRWDNLKLLLIFLVVLGHIFEYMKKTPGITSSVFILYSFHMPLFLFVSGLFCKKKIKEKSYDKIFSYLIIYFLAKIVCFYSNIIMGQEATFSLLSERELPWYAFVLFVYCLITIGLQNFSKKYVFIASIILASVVGYDSSISDYLVLSRIIVFYPFFFAGYCLDSKKVSRALSGKVVKIISAILLVLFVIAVFSNIEEISWWIILFTGRNPFSALGDYEKYGGLLRLLYYPFVFILGALVIAVTPENTPKDICAKLGGRSLQVYVLHKFFMNLFFYAFDGNDILVKIWPKHFELLTLPLALIITLICSLKI